MSNLLKASFTVAILCSVSVFLFQLFNKNSIQSRAANPNQQLNFTPSNHIKNSTDALDKNLSKPFYFLTYQMSMFKKVTEQDNAFINYKVEIQTQNEESSIQEIKSKEIVIRDQIADVFAKYQDVVLESTLDDRMKIKFEIWHKLNSILDCTIGKISITDIKVVG